MTRIYFRAAAASLAMLVVAAAVVRGPRGAPPAPAEQPPRPAAAPAAWLEDVTSEVGLDFVHETGATGLLLLPEIMCGGGGVFDYDGDGDLDLYVTTGRHLPAAAKDDPPRNRLYRQEADGRFTDVTAASGLGDPGYGMGLAVGDYDNDGDRDVYVTNLGKDRLYRNRGDGTFQDVTGSAGIGVGGWSSSATFLDYDRDGFLDLFVARYVVWDPKKKCTDAAGRLDYCSPAVFPPASDVLLHNDGDGTFTDVSAGSGIFRGTGAGLGVVILDANDDGWPDIYVANDGYANHLWINLRDGKFRESALLSGVAYNLHGAAEAGMGVLAADLDGDLHEDLFLTHLANETNTFYRDLGGPKGFADRSGESGLAAASLPYTGFGAVAVDLELDGDLDLLVTNGRVTLGKRRPGVSMAPPWDRIAEPNLAWLNRGGGTFGPEAAAGRSFTTPVEISRALVAGDLDGDGDVDVAVVNAQAGARLYRNQAPRKGNWLTVRAVDPRYRRDAIGAVVTVTGEGIRRRGTVRRASGYLSSHDPRVHFGLGATGKPDRVEVRWPDGLTETFPVPGVNRHLTLVRGASKQGQ